jgi:hypothetical protein
MKSFIKSETHNGKQLVEFYIISNVIIHSRTIIDTTISEGAMSHKVEGSKTIYERTRTRLASIEKIVSGSDFQELEDATLIRQYSEAYRDLILY